MRIKTTMSPKLRDIQTPEIKWFALRLRTRLALLRST
jgi:hypothetical protein